MNPLISVIVPIYNVEQYLRECVDSILAQTYENFELILVNDGSTDNSLAICQAYAERDTRIRVIDKANGGQADARNVGIELAAGKYICFVDSDDYVAYNYLEAMYSAAHAADADVCICDFTVYCEGEASGIFRDSRRPVITDESLLGIDILKINSFDPWYYEVVWNKLYKRNVFASLRFPAGRIYEDTYIFHHIFFQCERVCHIADILYFYRRRSGSTSDTTLSKRRFDQAWAIRDRIRFYEEHGLFHLLKEPYCSYIRLISIFRTHLESCDTETLMEWKKQKRIFNSYLTRIWRSKNLNAIFRYYVTLICPAFFLGLRRLYISLRSRRWYKVDEL